MDNIMDIQVDSSEMNEYTEQAIEDTVFGNDTGQNFAWEHIIKKMNLFIDEYRRNGYSEDFVNGFIEGINDVTGGNISLEENTVDEETAELLDNGPDSD